MKRGGPWRRWARALRPDPVQEIEEELGHHVEARIRDYVDRGLDPESARHAALERMGELDRVRSECVRMLDSEERTEERRMSLRVSWLDVKLGARMLVKYPGLSLVAVVGMAVAIAIGAGSFAFIYAVLDPSLPLEEGDRIVTIQNWDPRISNPNRRLLYDLSVWREEVESVRNLGAFRINSRNLVTSDGTAELIQIAEMNAAGFELARVSPVLGRRLADGDEGPGAPPVVVIAYEEWQRLFGGDPDIIGRVVRLGQTVHSVIGVMPEGFRFPLSNRYWVPLRLNPSDYEIGGGPSISVFGRLADGVTMGQARAELAMIGERLAAAYPDTHAQLRPQVLPYAHPFFDIDSPAMAVALHALQIAISMLMIVVSVNVAILVYARTAARWGEIAVRMALGASRRRVLAQLFVEALLLSAAAAVLGLGIAGLALAQVDALLRRIPDVAVPFWWDLGLSPGLVAYVVGLALIGGVIVGVIPGLKATGQRVQAGLQQLSSRGSQMQLGRTWTMLIVVQVGIAVAILPAAVFYASEMARFGTHDPGYAIDEFISGWFSLERDEFPAAAEAAEYERAFEERMASRAAELVRRLDAEPGIGVTYASYYPGIEPGARIEVEGVDGRATNEDNSVSHVVTTNNIGIGLFALFDVPIVAGRGFVDADMREGSTAVIVDRSFVDSIANGANVIGRRFRYLSRSGRPETRDTAEIRWFEIVGVVPDFPNAPGTAGFAYSEPRIYHPAAPARAGSDLLIVRVRGRAAAEFAGPLRAIAAAVDPSLQLHDLLPVSESRRMTQQGLRLFALGIGLLTGSVILLSAAGIYAMMSFTVARRRREIGIRSALGANPRRLLTGIFARAGVQLGAGVAVGLCLAIALDLGSGGWIMGGRAPVLLPIVSVLIVAIGMMAAIGPARRGLAIQPTEALREE